MILLAALLAAAAAAAAPATVELSPASLAGLPAAQGAGSIHGVPMTCEGAWLIDVVARAGLPTGDAVRGPALTQVIVAEAADGYRVAFTLGEIDRKLGNTPVLVANRCDGKPPAAGDGPFRLLAIGDTRRARSVRQLVRLRFVAIP